MDVTNRFVLDYARRHGGRILDYGCGGGELVAEGLASGLAIHGADIFYAGSNAREEAARRGLLGTSVREIGSDGRIPFADGSFDLVTNNQVMEHVEDLDAVLREIDRVLVPTGMVLSIFPDARVWREGHIGIPFSHWFRRGSRLRFYYTWGLRALGLGTWKEQSPTPRQWAIDKLAWIDAHTRDRSRAEILATYSRYFTNEFRERDYIRFRMRDRGLPAGLTGIPVVSHIGVVLFRKLAFLVFESRKAG